MEYDVTLSNEKEERLRLYDEIIAATYANIYSLSKQGNIKLKDFCFDFSSHRVFLEVSCMVGYLANKEIYVQCSFWDFLKIKFTKKDKHIHRIKPTKFIEGIDIHEVASFEAKAFGKDLEVFKEIYETYYKKGK